ncbi:MAG TPA: YbhB/YbcL family Raf kinase inhibitor-like protein [Nostocaceae cyanobacterium]|nr:YbhB/YbcL family Raf kinase inhibitor-like protein [Nostocaceae cyanobacterium]
MHKRRVILKYNFAILGLVGFWLIGCSSHPTETNSLTPAAKTMKLVSSAFENNSLIPPKYTCDGEDFSPPLSWDEVPPQTQSLVLIVDDPDAPIRTFVHWVIYDLPPTSRQLPEQIPQGKTINSGGVQGKNDFDKLGYGGPCPPSGTHRYFFHLYALDKKLNLPSGASKSQILTAMDGHVLAKGELIGRYQRQRLTTKRS